MGVVKGSIRYKFGLALILAACLPLAVGIVSIQLLGRRHYRDAEGSLYQSISHDLALNLSLQFDNQINLLGNWVETSSIAAMIDQGGKPASLRALQEQVDAMEEIWSGWSADDPALATWLDNPAGESVRRFQALNPLFAEILLTDRYGRLAAASNRTSDYFQADEQWWQCAFHRPRATACLHGVNYDESAQVYSIDIAMPLHDGSGSPVGVLKCIVNINPLLAGLDHRIERSDHLREVVLEDGRVLLSLREPEAAPFKYSLPKQTMDEIVARGSGWGVFAAGGAEGDLIGYGRIGIGSSANFPTHTAGLEALYAVVRCNLDSVMAPVHRQLMLLSLSGLLLMLACLLGGFYLSDRVVLRPVRNLERAARAISDRAYLRSPESTPATATTLELKAALELVAARAEDSSGDEIRQLGSDFLLMARRVLGYHQQLEGELAEKTEEIAQDLALAREFQEALLPKKYPTVPSGDGRDPVALGFYHIYKPASLVSGDLVHMIQLSDHKAAVFVADVMGHGTRSALISAILRTLVQNMATQTDNPAQLMEAVNEQFHQILPLGQDLVFATAVCGVFDTREMSACFAIAGHPAPLVINDGQNSVNALVDLDDRDPAIGLMPDSHYRNIITSFRSGYSFLFFTDGVIEAQNEQGEEFGEGRLAGVVANCDHCDGQSIANSVMQEIDLFMGTTPTRDDICLVTVTACQRDE
jgi:phosphoserine phosphatase RsbU/P